MRIVVALLLAGFATPSLAEDFIKGVWAKSEDLCRQAKENGVPAIAETGETVLTARGIEGIEYNCEFLTITPKAKGSPSWVVTALCQEPGFAFPDVLSVLELGPGQLDLQSVRPADENGNVGNAGTYVLCEGVTMP